MACAMAHEILHSLAIEHAPFGSCATPLDGDTELVSFGRLRRPKADMLWVAAAGPLANLFMAIGWAVLFRFAEVLGDAGYQLALQRMADAGMHINAILMVLNLIPIPPLDGFSVLLGLLPDRLAYSMAGLQQYGGALLLLLVFFGQGFITGFIRLFAVPFLRLIGYA